MLWCRPLQSLDTAEMQRFAGTSHFTFQARGCCVGWNELHVGSLQCCCTPISFRQLQKPHTFAKDMCPCSVAKASDMAPSRPSSAHALLEIQEGSELGSLPGSARRHGIAFG